MIKKVKFRCKFCNKPVDLLNHHNCNFKTSWKNIVGRDVKKSKRVKIII